jgi:hypothetical protein
VPLGAAPSIALGQTQTAALQAASAVGTASAEKIVQQLGERNRQRADRLKSYTDRRTYTVAYHGFPAPLTASMVVQATYDAPPTKHFNVLSHTGSKLLFTRVLQKLLETEIEAAKNPGQTALTPANYSFTLLGEEAVMGRRCYVLRVEPKVKSIFLYEGKVYVDAEDYALTQIEAEPAKSPSIWIKATHIHHVYAKTGQFWLPEQDRSSSTLRFGGTAVLTIDYGTYQVQSVPSH